MNWKENCFKVDDKKIPFIQASPCYIIPPKTRKNITIKLINTPLKEDFIDDINIRKNLFIGNALVKNIENSATIMAINTDTNLLKISIPPCNLIEVEKIKRENTSTNFLSRLAGRRKKI